MKWWWLSFADADAPKGEQFLGAVLVAAHDFFGALKVASTLGINPGGEVKAMAADSAFKPQHGWADRLLSKEECEAFDRAHGGGR